MFTYLVNLKMNNITTIVKNYTKQQLYIFIKKAINLLMLRLLLWSYAVIILILLLLIRNVSVS